MLRSTDWHHRAGDRRLVEPADPPGPLLMLATRLAEDLPPEGAELTVRPQRTLLTLAYHHIVILTWKVVDSDLMCTPIGWHHTTYTAGDPGEAHRLTVRLVFEFLRQFHDAPADDRSTEG
jgi:hypothetical protein